MIIVGGSTPMTTLRTLDARACIGERDSTSTRMEHTRRRVFSAISEERQKKRASDAAKVAKSAATGAALEAAGRGSQKLVDNYRYNDGSNAKTSVGKKIGNKLHSLANDRRVKTLAESQSDVDAFKRNHGGQGPRLRDSLEYRNSAMNARQNAKLFRDEAIRQSAKRDVAKAYGDTERYNEAVSLTKQCLSTAIGQEHRYSQLTGGSMVVENAYDY